MAIENSSTIESQRTAELNGRVALVTGASRGIGHSITELLRRDGATVIGVSRNGDCPAADRSYACDVSQPAAITQVVSEIIASYGRLDIIVNNAGIIASAALAETSIEIWNSVITVNLTGTFLVMRESLPIMVAQGWGRIVNIASVSAKQGERFMSAYAASKHGVLGLTRSVALEVADRGITVNAICPGPVETDMLVQGAQQWAERLGRPTEIAKRAMQFANPQRRFFRPEEVAEIVRFLVSEAASGINGQAINLCGGAVAA